MISKMSAKRIQGHVASSGSNWLVSPLRINPDLMRRGLALTSSIIFAMYSPTSPTAKRLMAPKNNDASKQRREAARRDIGYQYAQGGHDQPPARWTDRAKRPLPAESIFSGALLNEKMPRFAHSRFFRRLFVLSPNARFGRT